MAKVNICVVGSANLDMNSYVERFPVPGETLHGKRFTTGYGGKGANQAVMAARLGCSVSFVARVGDDLFGRDMLANFRNEGIDTQHVLTTAGTSTGTAVITVDASGRNTIIVTPGANGLLTAADVEAAREVIEAAQVLVCQQEVPMEANLAALRIAAKAGIPAVYNPAPANADLPAEVYGLATVLCPNEPEASLLTGGQPVGSDQEVAFVAAELRRRGARNVVITRGERGSLRVSADGIETIPVAAVTAVDTTGAGDAFIGSLAFFLARGSDLATAIDAANQVAAISVQFLGTQTSYPHAADLPVDLLTRT